MPLSPPPSSPIQLSLPWLPPPLPLAPALPLTPLPLAPRQVWAGLSSPQQAHLRQTLVALLQEVIHVRDAR
jgi:hypothetical protein